MPRSTVLDQFHLSLTDRTRLELIAASRSESVSRVLRASVLLAYHSGSSIAAISRNTGIDRPQISRTIYKSISFGPLAALDDLSRSGRPRTLTNEARAWIVSLACQKPLEFGYSYELWTMRLLAEHIRTHHESVGHSCLAKLAPSTVCKILSAHDVKPHKIQYYLERRDPDFDQKMAKILYVYKEVALWRSIGLPKELAAVVSYDEKPGIQAIGNTAPDLPPQPGKYPTVARDYEYVRHGTVSLLAGINLVTGAVHALVRDKHRSLEFIEFLELLDKSYPPETIIRVVLDNHSAHVSKETSKYLETKPGRFEFIFTPKHGSWLNIIETFFGKMTNSMLRGIRVPSKAELIRRLELYIAEVNLKPVVTKWNYMLDTIELDK
jgi:transposase